MTATVPRKPEELQQVLHYQFKNPALLRIALTHTSYANESKVPATHNERLSFWATACSRSWRRTTCSTSPTGPRRADPHARQPCQRGRAVPVCQRDRTRRVPAPGPWRGTGRRAHPAQRRVDAFEAVIAALYLDGGLEAARRFILPFLSEGKTAEEDYKTRLQEVVQQDPGAKLTYVVEAETGPDHAKQFTVGVFCNGRRLAGGVGRSKKAAEQHAAQQALRSLPQ